MKSSCDGVIVLGYDVSANGQIPQEAKNRVLKAKEVMAELGTSIVIFSGNVSLLHRYEPKKTEAQAMADYALQIGITKPHIIVEGDSRDTHQNAEFTKVIVDKNHWKNLIVITGGFHKPRAQYIFRRVYSPSYNLRFVVSDNGLSRKTLIYKRLVELNRWFKAITVKYS